MTLIEELNWARKKAGLVALTDEEQIELAEKKLSGQEKEDFLAKMGGKKTKKDKEVDDGKPGPSKDARKSMDDATIKPSTKGKKKMSEELNALLAQLGADPLTERQIRQVDAAKLAEDSLEENEENLNEAGLARIVAGLFGGQLKVKEADLRDALDMLAQTSKLAQASLTKRDEKGLTANLELVKRAIKTMSQIL